MKIGIYLNSTPSVIGGGREFERRFLEHLFDIQSRSKHEFVVLYSGEVEKDRRIEYIDINSRVPAGSAFLGKLRDYYIKKRYKINSNIELEKIRVENVLHDNDIQFLIYLKQGDILTYDIPYLTVVWDIQHRILPFFPEVSYKRVWQKREYTLRTLLQRAALIVTGTNAGKKQIQEYYQISPERIIVSPMPVPKLDQDISEHDIDNILRKYHLGDNYLLYPAQLWPHKNHVTLLKAIKILKNEYGIDFWLVCTGKDMGNKKYIEEYAKKLGISEYYKYLGFVDRKELTVLYKRAFALTFVSFFGPDNIPPLEAFVSGCPVIASDIEGANEQLAEAALFINPCSASDIADAVYKLYSDGQLRESLINKGYEHINSVYRDDYMDNILKTLDSFGIIRECWSSDYLG